MTLQLARERRWFEVDLFPRATQGATDRAVDVAAVPVDAPRRLAAAIDAAALRLRALPPPEDLGHRTIAYRARLQQVLREASRASDRLADGTYGTCSVCAGPISLARLSNQPWAPRCRTCDR
jgi:hypothetical protein